MGVCSPTDTSKDVKQISSFVLVGFKVKDIVLNHAMEVLMILVRSGSSR